jgi:hypothetical protein
MPMLRAVPMTMRSAASTCLTASRVEAAEIVAKALPAAPVLLLLQTETR